MDGYLRTDFLGEGTFAVVYKAVHKQSGKIVALKKTRLGNSDYGLPLDAIRENKSMNCISGKHIIELKDCFVHKKNVVMVLEFMEGGSLEQIIHDTSICITEGDIKAFLHMTLNALIIVHSHSYVHRDIKPNNLLLSSSGAVRLGDFGLARVAGSPEQNYSPAAFANWYRPPEMLLGAKKYTSAVDIWAAGCVFAELFLRKPIFQTKDLPWREIPQIKKIYSILGTPNENRWPGCIFLPKFITFRCKNPIIPLDKYISSQGAQVSSDAINLLAQLISLDPLKRPTAEEAIKHKFFHTGPLMTNIVSRKKNQKITAKSAL